MIPLTTRQCKWPPASGYLCRCAPLPRQGRGGPGLQASLCVVFVWARRVLAPPSVHPPALPAEQFLEILHSFEYLFSTVMITCPKKAVKQDILIFRHKSRHIFYYGNLSTDYADYRDFYLRNLWIMGFRSQLRGNQMASRSTRLFP